MSISQRCFRTGLRSLFGSIDGAPLREVARIPCEACVSTGRSREDADTIPGELVNPPDHDFDVERRQR